MKRGQPFVAKLVHQPARYLSGSGMARSSGFNFVPPSLSRLKSQVLVHPSLILEAGIVYDPQHAFPLVDHGTGPSDYWVDFKNSVSKMAIS